MTAVAEAAVTLDRIVREPERARITGLSRTTAWLLEKRGEFPARLTLTPGAVGWRLSELLEWVEARQAGPRRVPEEAMKAAAAARRRMRRR